MGAALTAGLAALLAACATVPRLDAAGDVHAFLVSIRDGDRATFDAHVDKPALKAQLRARLLASTAQANGAQSLPTLGALVAGPLVDVAVDALVRPEVFRAIAEMHGYSASTPIPGRFLIAQRVRAVGDGSVCVFDRSGGPCVLDFRNEDGTWRLAGFEGDLGKLLGGKPAAGRAS